MKALLSIDISSVKSGLLCYQNQLLHSLCCQLFCLFYQFLHGETAIISAKLRNDTIGTVLIAALRDLQMCIMSASSQHTLGIGQYQPVNILTFQHMLAAKCFFHRLDNAVVGSGSQHCIHFRNLVNDLLLITLCHTSGHDQSLTFCIFFVLCHLQDRVNTLFLGITNKTAGVHNDHICFHLVICKTISLFCQKSQHHF